MTVRVLVCAVVLAALATSCESARVVDVAATQADSPGAVVPPGKARRIAAQWGGTVTYLPTWAPNGVALSDWSSRTCACATDDSLLTVKFARRTTRLVWEVSDPREITRLAGGVVCREGRFAGRIIDGRTVFYRRDHGADTAWICIPVSGGWGPNFPIGKLTISVRQVTGRAGQLSASDLERMVASAHPSAPGRAGGSGYELPSTSEVHRMAVSFRRPLFLPTKLPGGFIFSQWHVAPGVAGFGGRRELSAIFGRDGLFTRLEWRVSWDIDVSAYGDCSHRFSRPREVVVNGRATYANEAIHAVSVWTCIPPNAAGNAKPLEVSLWYDIRLHSPAMLRLARRMIGTARLVQSS
jgi:hypothetical protein